MSVGLTFGSIAMNCRPRETPDQKSKTRTVIPDRVAATAAS